MREDDDEMVYEFGNVAKTATREPRSNRAFKDDTDPGSSRRWQREEHLSSEPEDTLDRHERMRDAGKRAAASVRGWRAKREEHLEARALDRPVTTVMNVGVEQKSSSPIRETLAPDKRAGKLNDEAHHESPTLKTDKTIPPPEDSPADFFDAIAASRKKKKKERALGGKGKHRDRVSPPNSPLPDLPPPPPPLDQTGIVGSDGAKMVESSLEDFFKASETAHAARKNNQANTSKKRLAKEDGTGNTGLDRDKRLDRVKDGDVAKDKTEKTLPLSPHLCHL